MSEICATGATGGANPPKSGNPGDLEFYNHATGTVVFAFRAAAGSMPVYGVTSGITALAGGGQSGATPLTSPISLISTVANNADSVILPASLPGMELTVVNGGTHSLAVFPAVGEQINTYGANTAFSSASASPPTVTFFTCVTAGQWYTK